MRWTQRRHLKVTAGAPRYNGVTSTAVVMQPDVPSTSVTQLNSRRSSRRDFLMAASLLGARSFALGQNEPTFSAGVKVVNVLATVRTKKNEIVRDLAKDD